ncbi:uncharacterized protein LOC103310523 isoform X2 [Acyrthosiphon pisum]|uniref:Uncharacterized protein n=1 Tax=Acyrthosiphon pisum TaxID=7029 RepID=A0A8R2NKC9_ACYPI|nr:uncharacterized protein LOC103310523 isoform X2 [Acyrthosiphon pisum]
MDASQISSCESDPMKVLTSKEYEPTNFINNSHSVGILEDLQSLRKEVVEGEDVLSLSSDDLVTFYFPVMTLLIHSKKKYENYNIGI